MANDVTSKTPEPVPSQPTPDMNSGGMLIARIIVMLLIFAVVWCGFMLIPYTYRLVTNAWAAPLLHGKNSYTGTWVGTLYPPPVKAPDLRPSPFLSERNREESIQDYELSKKQARDEIRVVMVSMSLDFFHLGSAKLGGKAKMCDTRGRTAEFKYTSTDVSDHGMWLILYNDTQGQGGDLKSTYDGTVLKTEYLGFDGSLHGELHRGGQSDFDRLCGALASGQDSQTH